MKPAEVLIVGAGFAGLGAAIRLIQAGVEDIVILERGTDVGGTWRDNTYPGAACDIPSLLYSYSFVPNPDWSRAYSEGQEILEYIRGVVERFGLRRYIRFGAEVVALEFDDRQGTWTAHTRAGEPVVARTVVMASGPLSNASLPALRGLEKYEGRKIHSARWDHTYDFTGKRVAVVGTGASAIQIVPELVKRARKLTVFQRTPGWVLPKYDHRRASWSKDLFRRFPPLQAAARRAMFSVHEVMALGLVWDTPFTSVVEAAAGAHLGRQVKDPWLRWQLTPSVRAGCKRILLSNDFYPALQRPNCKLVTWPIATLAEKGIRTADGIEHQVDCIVFATGFDVASKTGWPFRILGAGGRSLADEWAGGASGYKSVSVAGFPNLFFLFGPNSGPGHNSALFYLESEIDYAVRAIRLILARDLRSFDVKREIQDRYNADLQQRLRRTTWNSGCNSWYLTSDGHNATMFPGFATQFARLLGHLALEDYEMHGCDVASQPSTGGPATRPRARMGAIASRWRERRDVRLRGE